MSTEDTSAKRTQEQAAAEQGDFIKKLWRWANTPTLGELRHRGDERNDELAELQVGYERLFTPSFCDICGRWPASQLPQGKRCWMCESREWAAAHLVPLPNGKQCLEDLAAIGVPGAAQKLAECDYALTISLYVFRVISKIWSRVRLTACGVLTFISVAFGFALISQRAISSAANQFPGCTQELITLRGPANKINRISVVCCGSPILIYSRFSGLSSTGNRKLFLAVASEPTILAALGL